MVSACRTAVVIFQTYINYTFFEAKKKKKLLLSWGRSKKFSLMVVTTIQALWSQDDKILNYDTDTTLFRIRQCNYLPSFYTILCTVPNCTYYTAVERKNKGVKDKTNEDHSSQLNGTSYQVSQSSPCCCIVEY